MKTAKLHNGNVIAADQYDENRHSQRIYCMDSSCQTPLIFVAKNEHTGAHFKTIGKGDSKHEKKCGFYQPLTLIETIEKTHEYQDEFLENGIKEKIIRLNMKAIDPDYKPKKVDREEKKENEKQEEVKVKSESTPGSIGSLKGIVKLLSSYSPDILSTILVDVGGGRKYPLSDVVVDQEKAHQTLWEMEDADKRGFFVFGCVDKVVYREKVCYVNFVPTDVDFTLVIFEKYFDHFTFKHEELKGKRILAFGYLRKNDYNDNQKTEMVIKSNKYIEEIKENQ